MRDEIKDYLKTIKFQTYTVSDELPFSNSGTVLYLKNPKRIYVDTDQVSNEVFIPVINGVNVDAEVTTVRVYFSNDSKQLPKDYQQTISMIKASKDLFTEYFRRVVDINTEHEGDLLVTTIEFRFTQLLQG